MPIDGEVSPWVERNHSQQVWRTRAPPSPYPSQPERVFTWAEKLAANQAENLIRIVNESAQLANNSKNLKTRRSRLGVAQDRLAELKILVAQNLFLSLTSLKKFESDLQVLMAEIEVEECSNSHDYPNSDIISGLKFCATMQLRTPLRVLLRHGELFSDLPNEPPQIARATWEGIWTTQTRSFRELGIDLDEPAGDWMASAIGPISTDGGDYLKFLIAVRRIAESANSIDDRIASLVDEVSRSQWSMFKHARFHSAYDIADCFFPLFVYTIPRLTRRAAEGLRNLGLDTPDTLDGATDARLLQLPGIGPRTLGEIRKKCAETTIDRDSVRVDQVER